VFPSPADLFVVFSSSHQCEIFWDFVIQDGGYSVSSVAHEAPTFSANNC
jgi:hypothetical protein